jgi:hypothetical protein
MSFTIEMTPRGVLLAGGFRTEDELNHMITEDKRNTMIVACTICTNQPVPYFQGMNDDELVGKLATSVFLDKADIRNREALHQMTDDDQRNTLIVVNNMRTDRSIPELQGKSNKELVQIGLEWFTKSRTVAAILEFYWNMDQQQVVSTMPEVIATQTYDNRDSTTPLEDEFIISKEIRNSSSFSHDHSLDVSVGVSTQFKAGIPFLAANKTTVSLDVSTSNTWSFGEENTTTQSYSRRSPVTVAPGGHIQRTGTITKGAMDVAYRAKIRAADGSISWIEGTWSGASTVSLVVKQIDLKSETPVLATV